MDGTEGRVAEEGLMTPREAAELARCSDKAIYAWAKRGDIPRIKLGSLVRFRRTDIETWIAGHREQTHT